VRSLVISLSTDSGAVPTPPQPPRTQRLSPPTPFHTQRLFTPNAFSHPTPFHTQRLFTPNAFFTQAPWTRTRSCTCINRPAARGGGSCCAPMQVQILEHVRHPNVVTFYGAVTQPHAAHLAVVQELCSGSVFDYLQKYFHLRAATIPRDIGSWHFLGGLRFTYVFESWHGMAWHLIYE
jgi:hypothetical protein